MSEYTLGQDVRLNDSLERSIMDAALNNGEAVSIVNLSKDTLRFVARKVAAVGAFVVELSEALNKARAKSERYAGSPW